ncbi:hypothetical protein JB92DRAFT_2913826 [Gautieria morchelliformis]|nr:hypothetical protein JB92DRAFT_2913826 [Gautieria morchelliformis]
MLSVTQLLTIAACAIITLAANDAGALHAHCDGAKLIHDTPIEVNGKTVSFTGFSCTPKTVASRDLSKRSINVCGEICSNSCNTNAGNLPPIIDDCAQIKDAITIFAGQTSPTFTVAPYGLETLTFGTCSFFFQSNDSDYLEYCWSDLSTQASSAASACFPPVMPINSEGLCTPSDNTWEVGAAHS